MTPESVMVIGMQAIKVGLMVSARCWWPRWSPVLSSVFCRPPPGQRNDHDLHPENPDDCRRRGGAWPVDDENLY